ncbi:Putative neural-cadherin 2,Neural-cadherin [Lepeophtheirus salmonis]|uniref:Neural-cadherin 2,Neural-cadherin n=1 Tax=Lepeophtheirus salmonis TaxID=72036 RepID=A0A7R8CX70_LEPSM|nr:Putative neural-cadherin 2,Neural-cadherin [Lepeophtheirus salmonis]CAF2958683.1 Putative neural-cadherin 2,Neural-cadherin [Lepeophtheirus salmonis]
MRVRMKRKRISLLLVVDSLALLSLCCFSLTKASDPIQVSASAQPGDVLHRFSAPKYRHELISEPPGLVFMDHGVSLVLGQGKPLSLFRIRKIPSLFHHHYVGYIQENDPPGTPALLRPLPLLSSPLHTPFQLTDLDLSNNPPPFDVIFHPSDLTLSLISTKSLDYERQPLYRLRLSFHNNSNSDAALLEIHVQNEDDHIPIFERSTYTFNFRKDMRPNTLIGSIHALDADGDTILYRFADANVKCCLLVPLSGEILVTRPDLLQDSTISLPVLAYQKYHTERFASARVLIITHKEKKFQHRVKALKQRKRVKRRVTRAVRPTKRAEFTEADGEPEGKIVFQLEKESEHETFKIRDENPWVTVEPNGAVRVKKKWDYEELGREKNIDFWVIITNVGGSGHNEWRGLHYTDNQRVIIKVKDVNDEPPYFINRPLPMQAVVKLNALPNTPVFTLQAKDPDTDHNLHYFLVRDRTGGRFEVDERSGIVRSRGSEPFQLDMEYVLYVKAEDQNGRNGRRFQIYSRRERLSIVGGKRPPQFYMPSYEAEIPESQKKDSDIISVKAKSFAEREIRYTLKAQGQGAGTFNIGPSSGIVKLAKELDFEDLRQPHIYQLLVTATEDSGGFSTSVELTIRVSDVNDNAPKFELPDYQAHNVHEDIPIGSSILQVKSSDSDSGTNANIEYYVSDDHFMVSSNGVISNNLRLDADSNNANYEFIVTAKDKGEPPRTGTATVRIYTENKNDEEPKFSQQVYTPNVDENAGPNTLVTTVVASDKDGDGVTFGFVGGMTQSGLFRIEENTGVIRLISGDIKLDRDKYELNVTAMDDGKCCIESGMTVDQASLHTSTAVVVVFITDVNDNKPIFQDCSSYAPKIEESAPNGAPVIKVNAVDKDKGVNGQVRYSIVQQPNQKVFDREGEDGKFVSVTVKAVDSGEPSLEGVCSFTVEITDVNDNPPLFDRQKYVENVKQDTNVGTNILRVSASDEDADNNGAIIYSLTAPFDPADLDYFDIQPESGWIYLRKPLDRATFRIRVQASDMGAPPLHADVDVELDVVDRNNNPPIWEQQTYGPVYVRENAPPGEIVTTVRASSGIEDNPTVFYRLIRGSTDQTNKFDTFYLQQRQQNGWTYADVKVNHPLDYERIKEYNLTIRVENNGAQQLASEATIFIVLEDVNDEIPLFTEREQETVLEDKDGTFPNNQVQTGEVATKVIFDRESQGAYALEVEARDGAPSARPNSGGQPNSVNKFIRIGIADKNDNPPYFDKHLYEAEVDENEDIQHTVLTVTANDKDESSRIRYEITRGNFGGAFAVKNMTGAIYVAGPLDYETRKRYELRLVASDNLNENYTTIVIHVNDVNDNPPVFDRPTYETQITEEDDRNLPKRVLQVTATDGDKDREHNIVYFLTGQGIDADQPDQSKFDINRTTGEIFVLKQLDRDEPSGRPQWRFTVFAQDDGGSGLVGYADVQVNLKDINDNAPLFTHGVYYGNVTENGTAGMMVMTMTATDFDDVEEGTNAKLKYSIEKNVIDENTGTPIFEIEEETGVIKTAVCCLDREKTPDYSIQIVAMDGGGLKGTGTASIRVKDINDMPPSFTKDEWMTEVDEIDGNLLPDAPILTVTVHDEDESNKFHYKVIESSGFGADKFTMVRNNDGTGSLKVVQSLDFEDQLQRQGFRFRIQVNDKGEDNDNDKYHVAYSWVVVKLRDINDNKPVASDPDQGGHSRVTYSIDRSSDRRRQFSIAKDGTVSIQRQLDRETSPAHQIKILAIDDGDPPKTATATLTVIVHDINDNAPRFLKNYRPVLPEHSAPRKVVEVLATDDDDRSKGNGPSFTFRMDPNAEDIIRASFKVEHDPKGANGDGMAVVSSLRSFDRETQKEYLVPIVIKDSGNPSMSGTSTLTVVIGDSNDNKMQPGSKDIMVYNYMGQAPSRGIGSVYVYMIEMIGTCPTKHSAGVMESLSIPTFLLTKKRSTTVNTLKLMYLLIIVGLTDEDFVRIWKEQKVVKSKLQLFKEKLASVLPEQVQIDDIDVFSVMIHSKYPETTDVRFSVRGSAYYKPVKLNGILLRHREEFESELGINITMVGIDECLYENENCEGSCTNSLDISNLPYTVNSNKTALVGVRVEKEDGEFVANAQEAMKVQDANKLQEPFGEKDGAWYPPLELCEQSHLSIEFLTRKPDGVLLYNGPIVPPEPEEQLISDFLSLELVKAHPRLLVDFGSGTLELRIEPTKTRLDDGSWHRIDIFWDREQVRMVLDFCRSSVVVEHEDGSPTEFDDSSCQVKGDVPPFNEYLNVNTPLQIGGMAAEQFDPLHYKWSHTPLGKPFDGCIRNIIHNSKLYDLAEPGLFRYSKPGCIPVEKACNDNYPGSRCGEHGHCVGSLKHPTCKCNPGWTGQFCSHETMPSTFDPQSYVKYALSFEPDSFATEIQLRFRTREEHGELFRVSDQHNREYGILEIQESKLRFRYNLNSLRTEEKEIWLSSIYVDDGQWHTVKVARYGSAAILTLDGGESRRYNDSFIFDGHQLMTVDKQEGVYAGGKAEYTGVRTFEGSTFHYHLHLMELNGDKPLWLEIFKEIAHQIILVQM